MLSPEEITLKGFRKNEKKKNGKENGKKNHLKTKFYFSIFVTFSYTLQRLYCLPQKLSLQCTLFSGSIQKSSEEHLQLFR